VAAAVLVLVCALPGALLGAQQPASADSTVPLFVVMAAVNAAGYDTALDSPLNSPARKQVRAAVAAANPPSLAALRSFYAAHRDPNPVRDLSQWVSFGLLLGDPPDFNFRVPDAEVPAPVWPLRDLCPLLAKFYVEARLEELWQRFRPAYEAEMARYNQGLEQVMLQVNGYLRLGSSSFLGRDFSIYVNLLGAPEQADARSFGNDYYVVLSVSAAPQIDEVRHGYLHYVLDPMASKYRSIIGNKSDLKRFAEDAPALDSTLKANFQLTAGESLIRAVEVRLARMAPSAKQARVQEIVADGHILAPYFFEALELYEKQDAGMRIYYPDLIEKIDVKREEKRLAQVVFRPAAEARRGAPHEAALLPAGTELGAAAQAGAADLQKLLAQGEDALARHDLAQARQCFQAAAALKGAPQGRAVYGLALVATQQSQPELAKTYFQQAIDLGGDPHVVAWANIYMGRIFDVQQNRELAIKYYQEALKSGDPAPATRQAAERGLREPFRSGKSPGAGGVKP
jgi:tetratricopeptide (TPR) repeat protein